ncbi:MAG TPA: tetratricopeptide repeat protein, partial [Bryobacteraceae bacterium]|nr:tetratricopeptide repeat protein [Bryobacteraceae bacterium]
MAGRFAKLGAAAALLLVCMRGRAGDNYESLFQQAEEFSRQGRYGEAIERYKAALALRPGAPEALSNL